MKFNIRKATADDLKKIQELNHLLFEKEKKGYDVSLDMGWTYSEEGTEFFLGRIEKGFAFVAEVENKIIAYLVGGKTKDYSYRTTKGAAELDNMYTLEEYRNQGIGSALVKKFIEWCNQENCQVIKVAASAQNNQGIDFYKELGFKEHTLTLEINSGN